MVSEIEGFCLVFFQMELEACSKATLAAEALDEVVAVIVPIAPSTVVAGGAGFDFRLVVFVIVATDGVV